MNTIYKYLLNGERPSQTISLPKDALLLNVDNDPMGNLCFWAGVDTEKEHEDRVFYVIGTGHPLPKGVTCDYIGTAINVMFGLVWHVFVETN